jgi:hypothetical protein
MAGHIRHARPLAPTPLGERSLLRVQLDRFRMSGVRRAGRGAIGADGNLSYSIACRRPCPGMYFHCTFPHNAYNGQMLSGGAPNVTSIEVVLSVLQRVGLQFRVAIVRFPQTHTATNACLRHSDFLSHTETHIRG